MKHELSSSSKLLGPPCIIQAQRWAVTSWRSHSKLESWPRTSELLPLTFLGIKPFLPWPFRPCSLTFPRLPHLWHRDGALREHCWTGLPGAPSAVADRHVKAVPHSYQCCPAPMPPAHDGYPESQARNLHRGPGLIGGCLIRHLQPSLLPAKTTVSLTLRSLLVVRHLLNVSCKVVLDGLAFRNT